MKDSLPKALQIIQDTDLRIRFKALHWQMQKTIEKRRERRGLMVDTVRRYRYHLLPETPMQIIRFFYGEKVAGLCEGLDWGENAIVEREDEDGDPRLEDRWEEHYRKIDTSFVAQEYNEYSTDTIEAIMNISLFSLRRDELGPVRAKELQEAIKTIELLPSGDYRIENLIEIGRKKLNKI